MTVGAVEGRQVFEQKVTRGAIRLSRRWEGRVVDPETGEIRSGGYIGGRGGGSYVGAGGQSTAGRIQSEFSKRSRMEMRWQWSGLDWDLLGDYPAMLTWTYPAEWRNYVADARELHRHREALKEHWRRNYGPPVGVWVVEFQPRLRRPEHQRQAPHVHMYLGLPPAVAGEEIDGLRRRVTKRKNLEARYGKYEGRRRVPPVSGEVCEDLLKAWSRIVGTKGTWHQRRGLDVTPAFWSDDVTATVDRTAIQAYFWKESGKFGQKAPPGDFGGLSFYGRWGSRQGFRPTQDTSELKRREFVEQRRVLRRLAQDVMAREAAADGRKVRRYRGPRGMDGLTVFTSRASVVAARLAELGR